MMQRQHGTERRLDNTYSYNKLQTTGTAKIQPKLAQFRLLNCKYINAIAQLHSTRCYMSQQISSFITA